MSLSKKILFILTVLFSSQQLFPQLEKITCNPPAVNFELLNFCFGQTTTFKNLTKSSNKPKYFWEIFEPPLSTPVYTSTQIDISYKFQSIGVYTVFLTAQNPDGHLTKATRYLRVDSTLHADFEYENCQSYFTNYSTCADSFFWDFGDSTTSTEKSPNHLYKTFGVRTAMLIAKSGDRVDTVRKSFLTIPNNLNGGFVYQKQSDTLYFTAKDSISPGRNEYHWSWGDGTTTDLYGSIGVRQKHVYPRLYRDTTYTVMLLVRSMCYSNYSIKTIEVKDSMQVVGTLVYPNPMLEANLLRVLSENPRSINNVRMISMNGSKISQFQIDVKQNGIDISFDDLASGVYYLEFYIDDERKYYKIIKR